MTQHYTDYEQNFIQAMDKAGIRLRDAVIADGAIHRFDPEGKGHKDGWYVFYGMAGAFGDWSRGISETWSLSNHSVAGLDKHDIFAQIKKAREVADEEKCRKQEECALFALNKWNTLLETGDSPYLLKKKVEPFGVRFSKNYLILPLRDITGKLWSLQWIAPDGTKRFLAGGKKKGCFHSIGNLEDERPILITEGYATGASVHMATQHPTVIVFDAGNLEPVIADLKKAYPKSPLLIAGDDDLGKVPNVGREKAEEAAHKHGCSVVFPRFKNTETKPTDFNDLHMLEGLAAVKEQIEQIKSSTNAPLPDLLPIESTLLPVLPFALEMLPEPLQHWVKDIAYRRQCPLDFAAIPAILMVAGLIGARCSLKPNEKDDWMVIPNLWGGILGDPGTLKSPICSEVLFPFGELEFNAHKEYTEQKNKYEAEKTAFAETKSVLERQIKTIVEKNAEETNLNDEAELQVVKEKLANHLRTNPPEPSLKRYKVSDTTLEKMHEILSKNPGGVLIFRDELMGFLESWEKKGHESDRSFYLEAWNGDKPYTIDRIGRGTVHASNICVSILGTTQPDKIVTYLTKALTKLDNDGLLQRFQLLVYPDKTPWKLVDEYPASFAKKRVLHICKVIDTMNFTDYGAQKPELLYEGQYLIPYFRFSYDAQIFFHKWVTMLQEKLLKPDHPLILQHLSKYRSLMPSLALIFHIIRVADGKGDREVTLESAQQAATCCEYLESHARRIYGLALDTTFEAFPKLSKAEELLVWMKKQSDTPERNLTRRFIMRHSKFRSSKDLDPLLSDLVQMGYIQGTSPNAFSVLS